jgi:hypothetical protein
MTETLVLKEWSLNKNYISINNIFLISLMAESAESYPTIRDFVFQDA